jgi:cell division protein FtsI (penicillin-binding protein 3)/stage V sporulation protein D (sporulation-specific penicillin-binding protein)
MQVSNQFNNKRINIFVFIVILVFILIGVRLFYLQIVHGEEYKKAGEDQYFYTTGDNFDRGAINFSNLSKVSAPAVHMTNEYDLAIDPKTLKVSFGENSSSNTEDLKKDLYAKLVNAFDKYKPTEEKLENEQEELSKKKVELIDYENFSKKFDKDSSFEILATNVNEDIANEIIGERIRGVIVNRKKSRVYFEKNVAAKVLGFVGFAGNKKTGLYGLEKYYNDVLEKVDIKNTNFFAEIFADFSSEENTKEDIKSLIENNNKEGDLNLTIDVNVERYLNKLLLTTREKWNSEIVGGIIMDINDGSIIAMEEAPSFDPNSYKEVSDISIYNNDLISGVYEMGSIIKPLTVAAALDSDTVTESTTYNDTGSITLNGYTIYNFDKKARGPNTPLQQILSQSLNVGIAFLVQKMGNDKLSDYFHKFGIGDYTGIDLPNESSGLVANLDSDVVVDSVTAGFGQGIAITPIQTIRALATLGNGGILVTPHIVKSITYDNGETKVIAQDKGDIIFNNASTSERISKLLIKVVDEGMHAKNPKYTIAAKTGTAQMVNSNTGKYYEDRYLHSFFGYFPATSPRYIIFLYHTNPRGAQYASQTLKETFFELVDFLIGYYEIPPDR